jgi:hypothetical protein
MKRNKLFIPLVIIVMGGCYDTAFNYFGPPPEIPVSSPLSPSIGMTPRAMQCVTDSQCGDLICYKESADSYVGVCARVDVSPTVGDQ